MLKSSDLHVVAVYTNHRRGKNREHHLRKFIDHMKVSGVSLHVVELVLGDREFTLTEEESASFNYHKLRGHGSGYEIWLKEGMQRYAVNRLPEEAKYVAFIDADIYFQRSDWAVATLDALQVHPVVQPWAYSMDLGPDNNPLADENKRKIDRSFCKAWSVGDINVTEEEVGFGETSLNWMAPKEGVYDHRQHYGYAWAMTLDVWHKIGGLPDWVVLGSCDYISARIFAGFHWKSDVYNSEGCSRRLRKFAELCDKYVRQDIGVVDGIIHHGFHGLKEKRFYLTRGQIISESGFDPDLDLEYDRNGIPQLITDNRKLRDGARRLSMIRDEDSSLQK